MSEKKYSANDPERTLVTLDQLSQTIEVMTSVVNRLRKHLNDQISAKKEIEAIQEVRRRERLAAAAHSRQHQDSGMVVEVSKPVADLDERQERSRKDTHGAHETHDDEDSGEKILH